MLDFVLKADYGVYDLEMLIALLRSENGCPWDREQSHESIKRNMIEEAYEAAEAIDEGDLEHLKEELGDVLTQVVFHARIEEEIGSFDLDAVADAVCKKLIYRHPHIFGDAKVQTADEVLTNWDDLKRKEKRHGTVRESMDAVVRSLPALWRSEKVQNKAAKTGYEQDDIKSAIEKLQEELNELKAAVDGKGNAGEELGDVLFSAVTVARFLGEDPEEALGKSCDKFIKRFGYVEKRSEELGLNMKDMPPEEMDKLYNEAKTSFCE